MTTKLLQDSKNTITSTAAGSTNQFLGQLSGLVILWYGASLVLGESNSRTINCI